MAGRRCLRDGVFLARQASNVPRYDVLECLFDVLRDCSHCKIYCSRTALFEIKLRDKGLCQSCANVSVTLGHIGVPSDDAHISISPALDTERPKPRPACQGNVSLHKRKTRHMETLATATLQNTLANDKQRLFSYERWGPVLAKSV